MDPTEEELAAVVAKAWAMVRQCDEQIDAGRDFMVLVLTNRRPPSTERVRLGRGSGPLGEVMNWTESTEGGGQIVARFDPVQVRDWLMRELATVES